MNAATGTVRRQPLAGSRGLLLEFGGSKGNVLDRALMGQLEDALVDVAGEAGLRFLVLAGAGPHFSFGASVPEHLPGQVETMLPAFHGLLRRLDELDLPPVIAAVRGCCLGGGLELALACDVIAVEPDASLGCPEIKLGVFPPAGCALLPLRLPVGRAAAALLAGETFSGSAAAAAGLAELETGPGRLLEEVEAWAAERFGGLSAAALRQARHAARWPWRDALRRVLPELERRYLEELMPLRDPQEGLQAFLARRKPEWEDR